MEVEFKLFGSLTVRQAGFIAAGGGIALVLYFLPLFGPVKWTLIILSVIFGIALALVRINDQPLEVWVVNFFYALFNSQRRVWKKTPKVPEILSETSITRGVKQQESANEKKVRKDFQTVQISRGKLDQRRFEDSSVIDNISKQSKMAKPVQFTSSDGSHQADPHVSNENEEKILQASNKTPINEQEDNLDSNLQQDQNAMKSNSQNVKSDMNTSQLQKQEQIIENNTNSMPAASQGVNTLAGTSNAFTDDLYNVAPNNDSSVVVKGLSNQSPDRELTSSSSKTLGNQTVQNDQIKEPQEGEEFTVPLPVSNQVMGGSQPSQETASTSNTSQKVTSQPNKATIFNDIIPEKPLESSQPQVSLNEPLEENVELPNDNSNIQLSEENKALREKMADLSKQFEDIKKEMHTSSGIVQQKQAENDDLKKTIVDLQKEVEALKTQADQTKEQNQEEESMVPSINQASIQSDLPAVQPGQQQLKTTPVAKGMLQIYQGPSLTKRPNEIAGIVKDQKGKLLPGVVVIIKTSGANPRPVRAMQTNPLGQFKTASIIDDNGVYNIELSKDGNLIGVYEVELKGEVLPTYEFIV